MQPGFMCLESGLTRSKNSINVAVKNLADFGISVALFWAFGYALMFGRSVMGWLGSSSFFLNLDADPELAAFFLFQAMFCGTATTIVSGAVAERLKFRAYLIITLLISGLIYPIFGHWAWNGIASDGLTGWLGELGFVDFAGSTVVHSIGAWVGLAALLVIGPRTGRFPLRGRPRKIHGSNLPLSVLGAMLLWFGWLGFNGGSTLAFDQQVASIMAHTIVAGVAGMLTAAAIGWQQRKIPEVELLINGSLAGLVSITASCNLVTTSQAALIGAIGSAVMLWVSNQLVRWRIDDAVDAVAVHGGGGLWGSLAAALFHRSGSLDMGLNPVGQLWVQGLGIGVCFVWAFGLTWVVLALINRFWPLRVSAEAEQIGLNVSEHHAKTEVYDLFNIMDKQAHTQDLSLRAPVEPFTEVGHIAARYNQVMAALEHKNRQIVSYLQQVERLTAAAAAMESNTFQPQSLNSVAARRDKLGRLARVFQTMAQQVKARETRLQQAKQKLAQANQQLKIDVMERQQAEEALRLAEEKYRSIFENALAGIFQATPDGHYLSVNPAMARLFGYTSAEQMLAGSTKLENQHYVDPNCRDQLRRQLEKQGDVKEFEYQAYHQDGSVIWVSESTRAVRDAQGQLLYYEGIVKDVTERKQEAAALKRQVQELQVEIDQQKRSRQVAEITQTDYFRELQADVERLRFEDDEFWNSA